MKTDKNIILWGTMAILIVGGLVWFSRPAQKTDNQANLRSGAPGELVADAVSFDFGTVSMKNGKVSHTFVLENTGGREMKLTRMYTSCMCTTAMFIKDGKKFGPYGMPGHGGGITGLNQKLASGEKAQIEVVFDPAAHGPAGVGTIERAVYIENAASSEPLQLMISAQVTP